MEAVLKALAMGAAALFAVAVLTACWEHWFQRIKAPEPAPVEPPRPVNVDLDVDKLPTAPVAVAAPAAAPRCDQTTRQATLGAALDNMARPPADVTVEVTADVTATTPVLGPWIETRPMVLTSIHPETERH